MKRERIKWRSLKFKFFLILLLALVSICGLNVDWLINRLRRNQKKDNTIHLAAVSCSRFNYEGVRDIQKPMDLSLTMVKSAVLFAQNPMHVHLFTEDDMVPMFDSKFEGWPQEIRARVKFSVRKINYNKFLPEELSEKWQKWYKPCGSYRLFLPMILKDLTSAAIYSDSDVIFIKPIDELWAQLKTFQRHHTVAISPTSGHPLGKSKDNENFIFHDTGMFQINSGIMIMNFTRMLSFDWLPPHEETSYEKVARQKYGVELLLVYYKRYRESAEHDQKLLNIMFHFNPDFIKQLSCSWNFKNNFCQNSNNICPDAEDEGGAGAVHGITSVFFGDENPTFRALYEAFRDYEFDENIESKLLRPLMKNLQSTAKGTYCSRKSYVITEPLMKSIENLGKNLN